MRRTPLKRAAFKSHVPQQVDRAERLERRAAAILAGASPRHAIMAPTWPHRSAPKEPAPLRSEAYRRAVASLPCAWCGVQGYSQHAHENAGKGKGVKVDDRRAMPLCCARPGIEGCHAAFDQYRLVPGGREAHIELGRRLAARTRETLNAMGLWPAKVPQLPPQEAR